MPLPCSLAHPLDEAAFSARAHEHLDLLYGPRREEVLRRLLTLLSHRRGAMPPRRCVALPPYGANGTSG